MAQQYGRRRWMRKLPRRMRRQMQQRLKPELPALVTLYMRPPPGSVVAQMMSEILRSA
jgi:hypothetical protein